MSGHRTAMGDINAQEDAEASNTTISVREKAKQYEEAVSLCQLPQEIKPKSRMPSVFAFPIPAQPLRVEDSKGSGPKRSSNSTDAHNFLSGTRETQNELKSTVSNTVGLVARFSNKVGAENVNNNVCPGDLFGPAGRGADQTAILEVARRGSVQQSGGPDMTSLAVKPESKRISVKDLIEKHEQNCLSVSQSYVQDTIRDAVVGGGGPSCGGDRPINGVGETEEGGSDRDDRGLSSNVVDTLAGDLEFTWRNSVELEQTLRTEDVTHRSSDQEWVTSSTPSDEWSKDTIFIGLQCSSDAQELMNPSVPSTHENESESGSVQETIFLQTDSSGYTITAPSSTPDPSVYTIPTKYGDIYPFSRHRPGCLDTNSERPIWTGVPAISPTSIKIADDIDTPHTPEMAPRISLPSFPVSDETLGGTVEVALSQVSVPDSPVLLSSVQPPGEGNPWMSFPSVPSRNPSDALICRQDALMGKVIGTDSNPLPPDLPISRDTEKRGNPGPADTGGEDDERLVKILADLNETLLVQLTTECINDPRPDHIEGELRAICRRRQELIRNIAQQSWPATPQTGDPVNILWPGPKAEMRCLVEINEDIASRLSLLRSPSPAAVRLLLAEHLSRHLYVDESLTLKTADGRPTASDQTEKAVVNSQHHKSLGGQVSCNRSSTHDNHHQHHSLTHSTHDEDEVLEDTIKPVKETTKVLAGFNVGLSQTESYLDNEIFQKSSERYVPCSSNKYSSKTTTTSLKLNAEDCNVCELGQCKDTASHAGLICQEYICLSMPPSRKCSHISQILTSDTSVQCSGTFVVIDDAASHSFSNVSVDSREQTTDDDVSSAGDLDHLTDGSEDDDMRRLHQRYGEVLQWSDDASDIESGEDASFIAQSGVKGRDLRSTLTQSIKGQLPTLTSEGFRTLMTQYRKNSRRSPKGGGDASGSTGSSSGDSESDSGDGSRSSTNWGNTFDMCTVKLNKGVGGSPRDASTDIGDTLRPMDEAKPVLCDASTSMGERTLRVAMVTNSSVITEGEFGSKATGSGEWVSEDSLKSSTQVNEDQEILTETDALYQEIGAMDKDFVSMLVKSDDDDAWERLLQNHMQQTEELRGRRQLQLARCKQHLADKMADAARRRREPQVDVQLKCPLADQPGDQSAVSAMTSRSTSEVSTHTDDDANTDISDVSAELEQDMGVLQAKCLAELKSLQTMKCEADFIDILNDYRQRQQDLVRRRQLERDSVTDKLKKTLSKRGADGDSEPSVEQMDEVFYSDICRRQQELPLSEAALGSLIDNHLDRVDSFEKRVKDEVLQRRLQRTGNDERKLRRRASQMVREQKEHLEKGRRIRDRERERLAGKLKAKLALTKR